MGKKVIIFGFILLFFLCGVSPIVSMIIKSIYSGKGIDLSIYMQILSNKHQWAVYLNSILISLATTFFATIIGVPLAILFSRTDLPLRKFFVFLCTIPLFIPSYLNTILWKQIIGKNGIVSGIANLIPLVLIPNFLSGFSGALFLMTLTYTPIVMLLTMAYLNSINPGVEEAALLTSPWKRVLFKITLPLAKKGIIFSSFLVLLLSFGEFGIPQSMGLPVFSTESFTYFSAFYNFPLATALSTPVVLIIIFILILERKLSQEKTELMEYKNLKKPVIFLEKSKLPVFFITSISIFILIVLPVLLLFYHSLPLKNLLKILVNSQESIKNTFFIGLSAAFFTTLTGFFIGLGTSKNYLLKKDLINFSTLFTFAIPSTVLGIGLISLFNNKNTFFIYQSFILVICGFIGKYSLIPARITEISFNSIPPSLENAAELNGTNWAQILRKITIPLSRRQIIAAFLLSYVFCVRETELVLLVIPPGYDTLSVKLLNYMANGSEQLIASLAAITFLMCIIPLVPALIILKGENI